jgi:hypothetical protein
MLPPGEGTPLTDGEACRVVDLIRPCFDEYAIRYDERKYPPEVYERLLRAFGAPDKVTDEDIRTAFLWKFGHLGKQRIPSHHERLISCIQARWPGLLPAIHGSTVEVFHRLDGAFGGPYRYITVSFLLHLLRPSEVPIIDQFNFRAMHYYFGVVRPGWRPNHRPAAFSDLEMLSRFLSAITHGWRIIDPSSVPSQRDLDRFLMMKGKALNSQKAPSPRINLSEAPAASAAEESPGPRDSGGDGWISLPYGGPGATFHVSALIQHVKKSGRAYIIQGQTQCRLSAHRKPRSLDVWLRGNFANSPDVKQAVNEVTRQLVSTGLFEEGEFLCPDSGRVCKGILLVRAG